MGVGVGGNDWCKMLDPSQLGLVRQRTGLSHNHCFEGRHSSSKKSVSLSTSITDCLCFQIVAGNMPSVLKQSSTYLTSNIFELVGMYMVSYHWVCLHNI